jgi:hypothetical protein
MTKSLDAAVLALIAVLDERAKKNGEKSVVKAVVGRLADAGASKELIAEIAALRPTKTVKAKPAKSKLVAAPKANGKAKAGASEPASAEAPVVAG